MSTRIELGDISIDVVRKDIKNIHLSVYPPVGRVRISAPSHMKLETIRVYAISKLTWIKQEQERMRGQDRETRREFLDRESHYVWGRRYLLKVIERNEAPKVALRHRQLLLQVRPGADVDKKAQIIESWYREALRCVIPELIDKWEYRLGVKVRKFFVQRMKTRWGSCSHVAGTIRINTELAKKPPQCLEYIVVHEMMHLLEPTHSKRFVALMDSFMPLWRVYRDELNRLPVRHEAWVY